MATPPTSVVIRSDLIATRDEARHYYTNKLARAHALVVRGCPVTIVFEQDATHLYSIELGDPLSVDDSARVVRYYRDRRAPEVREFSLERARRMDLVLRAVTFYTVSVLAGGQSGKEKILLYGPALADAGHMRVVLRPGPGAAFTCVSAYSVGAEDWIRAKDPRLARPTRFPPDQQK